ncbi:MAG: glycosyltransferase family 2 protein [Phenylobacterium sp.]
MKILDRELGSACAEDYMRRLAPTAPVAPDEAARKFASFSEFQASKLASAAACRAELSAQADLFEQYLAELMEEDRLAVLVDTGWQGTIQASLASGYPTHEFWGANFGRYDYSNIDGRIIQRIMGLGFDANGYDPAKPLSALIHHRHLIEALFEPVGPSIERLERRDRSVAPIGAEAFAPLRPSEPALYDGMMRYLREVAPTLSYARLQEARDRAAEQLASDILFPTAEIARLLGGQKRSVDFGSEDFAPVLREPDGGDPEARIRAALWTQGQLALECRPAVAKERQRALLPKPGPRKADAIQPDSHPDPMVAIIMRTMDRVVFLQRALASIARQTFEDYVLVVFNDGGDMEGIEAELGASAIDRRRVVLLDGVENRGMEAASNAAIRAVRSEYIVIHDDDDSWHPGFLQKTVSYLEANPGAGGVVTQSVHVNEAIRGDRIQTLNTKPYNDWLRSLHLGELLIMNVFPPISFVFRRTVYEEVGGFNERLPVLGDWDFNIRFAARAEIGVVAEALANYHHRQPSGLGAYENSVTGAISLHERFNPVVRAAFVDDDAMRPLAGAMAIGPVLHEMRDNLRNLAQPNRAPASQETSQVLAAAADDRWCMLAYLRANLGAAAPDVSLATALAWAASGTLPPPPDFDEPAYLQQNRDVREFVSSGRIPSGYLHYMRFGRAEGRRRPMRIPAAV